MNKLEIPFWKKAILTVEEASNLACGLSPSIIRLYAARAIYEGQPAFECYKTGRKLCIVKDSFVRWLSEIGRRHEIFDIAKCQMELTAYSMQLDTGNVPQAACPKRGRPRKNRNYNLQVV